MGLNGSLSIASRALEVNAAGIQVAGNNIANANTPGYVRNQLILNTNGSSRSGQLIFGTGVTAAGIRQQIDTYLETRIYTANGDATGAQTRSTVYKQLESAIQELSGNDLSSNLNDFLSKINDVVNQAESAGSRQLAVGQGFQFAQSITTLRSRVDDQRSALGIKVVDLTNEANRLIDQISKLNPQIVGSESAGLLQSDASDLRNQRLTALNRLSEILPIKTIEHPTGNVDVFFGSENLVINSNVRHLETVQTVNRNLTITNVRVEGSNVPVTGTQGELNGVLNGRDNILGGFVDRLDTLASNTIFEFNKIHASGQGTKGYSSLTSSYKVSDPAAALIVAGLKFTPQNGSFQVKVINTTTGLAQTSTINITLNGGPGDTTLNSLAAQLGSVGNITAGVSGDRRLTLSAAPGYEIQFADDTSHALASLGVNNFFTGTDSQTIGVNSLIQADQSLFATARGGGPADSSNATLLARIVDNPVAGLGQSTIQDYYQKTIDTVSQSSASEAAFAEGYATFRNSLSSQRDQYSGVSLDEEAISILKFQHAYQVSGKFITTIDELFRTLLQI